MKGEKSFEASERYTGFLKNGKSEETINYQIKTIVKEGLETTEITNNEEAKEVIEGIISELQGLSNSISEGEPK